VLPFPGQKLRDILTKAPVEKKPEIQAIPSYDQKKEPKKSTQPVGMLQTNNPSIKEMLRDKKTLDEENRLNSSENGHAEPLSRDQLIVCWNRYVFQLKEENKRNLYAIFTKREPRIINDFEIQFVVDNATLVDLISVESPQLLEFLRQELKNSKIQLKVKPEEGTTESKTKLFSAQDRYNALVEKNPSLALLAQKFNLDLDF
jgi:hypothetical protein